MALLKLSVSSIDMTTTWAQPRDDRQPRSRDALRLAVHPEQRDYLQLKTGETFCSPSHADFGDRPRIAASLVIEEADSDDDSADNKLRYLSEAGPDRISHRSALEFHWRLAAAEFQGLLGNIRAGLIPTKASITLQHEVVEGGTSLRFNLQADECGFKWDNDNAAARKLGINIEQVTLQFRSLSGSGENDNKAIASNDEVRDQLGRIGGEIRRIGLVLISGIAALVIVTLIRH
jgi:hypothetical protein